MIVIETRKNSTSYFKIQVSGVCNREKRACKAVTIFLSTFVSVLYSPCTFEELSKKLVLSYRYSDFMVELYTYP